jgi:hypothetical protein
MGGGKDPFRQDATVFLVAGRSLGLQETLSLAVKDDDGNSYWPFESYDVAGVDVKMLPNRAIGYDGISVLVLASPRLDFRPDQLDALVEFVETGGRLLLFVNRQWPEVAHSRLAELLPVTLEPPRKVEDFTPLERFAGRNSSAINGEIAVPGMAAKPGAVVLIADGNVPIAVQGAFGMGTVTVVGLDPDSQAMRGWRSFPTLVLNLLAVSPKVPSKARATDFTTGPKTEAYIRPRGGFGSGVFGWAIILMMIGYIVVGGPVLFLVLRSLKRLDLSWPVYLGLSLVVAAGCFLVVSLVRNRATVTRTLTIVDFPADRHPAVGRSIYSMRFPTSSLYELTIAGQRGYIALKPSNDLSLGTLFSSDRPFRYGPTLLSLEDLPVKSNQYRFFQSQWRSPTPPPVVSNVQVTFGTGTRLACYRGSIRNGPVAISEAVLVGPKLVCKLSQRLGPGETVALDGLPCRPTAEFLRDEVAANVAGDSDMAMMGSPSVPLDPKGVSVREIFDDVCLSSCYELYRRAPLEPRDSHFNVKIQPQITRTIAAVKLDLSHVINSEYAILVGVADLDVPDEIRVNGKKADDVERLVIFRQVVPLGPAE